MRLDASDDVREQASSIKEYRSSIAGSRGVWLDEIVKRQVKELEYKR